MAVYSTGDYDLEKDIVVSLPVETAGFEWKVVKKMKLNDFAKEKINLSVQELVQERNDSQQD